MPQLVSEITSGAGEGANSKTRVFRIILSSPGETVNVEGACGVTIGSPHPADGDYLCTTYNANYEGDSRLVLIVTFSYAVEADGEQRNQQPPESRPATWSISSAIYERPVRSWRYRLNAAGAWGGPAPASNSADDFYDGVTTLDAMVTISIRQFSLNDITTHAQHVGSINEEEIRLGSLVMVPHTVMLRGVQAEAVAIPYGDQIYRGFNATYEFAYRENRTHVHFGANGANGFVEVALGWDIAVPQTGFNVKLFNPAGGVAATRDVFGQPLKHDNGKIVKDDNGNYSLPDETAAGDKARAMVLVYEYENGGASQMPSAMPIPLNDDGTPRKVNAANNILPLVYAYQVHRAVNITNTLGLRLP